MQLPIFCQCLAQSQRCTRHFEVRTMPPRMIMRSPLLRRSAIFMIRSEMPMLLAMSSSLRCVFCTSQCACVAHHPALTSAHRLLPCTSTSAKAEPCIHMHAWEPAITTAHTQAVGSIEATKAQHLERFARRAHAREHVRRLVQHLLDAAPVLADAREHRGFALVVATGAAGVQRGAVQQRRAIGVLARPPARVINGFMTEGLLGVSAVTLRVAMQWLCSAHAWHAGSILEVLGCEKLVCCAGLANSLHTEIISDLFCAALARTRAAKASGA